MKSAESVQNRVIPQTRSAISITKRVTIGVIEMLNVVADEVGR